MRFFNGSAVKIICTKAKLLYAAAVCLTVFLFSSCLLAQQHKVDSIKYLLKGNPSPPAQAMLMKDLAVAYQTFNPKEASRYYDEALNFADNNHLEYEKAVIYQAKAEVCGLSGDYKKAIKILDTALVSLSKTNHAKKGELMVKIYTGLSSNYRYANDPKKAVAYQLKGIAEAERLKMYSQLVKSYYNLSLIYKEMNGYAKQLDCSEKALEFAKKSGSKESLFIAHVAISQSYIFLEDYKKAAANIKAAQKNYNTLYAPAQLIGYHLISGLIYMNLNELDKANSDFNKSLRIAEASNQQFSIIQSKMQLSRVLVLQKRFSDAEKILKSSEADIAKTNEASQKLILLEYYSRLYKEWGKYDKALDYNVMNTALGDSLASLEHKNYIATLEKKYETGKKEAQIKQLQDEKKIQQLSIKQKQTLNLILIGGTVALLMIFLLSYRNYRHHQKLQLHRISELETEKQLAAAEAVLKGEEQERARMAKDLHDGLGGMLSGIKHSFTNMKENLIMTPENALAFSRGIELLDGSIKEMRRVAHNMMPEILMHFGLDTALKEFCIELGRDGRLKTSYQQIDMDKVSFDQNISVTVYRVVQELANNALKHAAATSLLVQAHASREDGLLQLTVEDNGKGFDVAMLAQPGGMGWKSIRNRVELLKGRIDINTAPGKGTSVLIEIPLS